MIWDDENHTIFIKINSIEKAPMFSHRGLYFQQF